MSIISISFFDASNISLTSSNIVTVSGVFLIDALSFNPVTLFISLSLLAIGVLRSLYSINSNIFAANQKHCLNNRNGAIITAPSVSVKSSPSTSGNVLFILHEGTKVEVTDNSMKEWKQIKVADGKDGWIETSKIEII